MCFTSTSTNWFARGGVIKRSIGDLYGSGDTVASDGVATATRSRAESMVEKT